MYLFQLKNPMVLGFQILCVTLFGFMCFVYPYVMFLIWRRSPKGMQNYRFFLMIISTSDFIFCLNYNLLIQPIALFPNYGSIVYGIAKGTGDTFLLIVVLITVLTVILTMFTQAYSLLYRHAAFSSNTYFTTFFQKSYMHAALIGYGIIAAGALLAGLGTSQVPGEIFKQNDTTTSAWYAFDDSIIAFQLDPLKSISWLIFTMLNLGMIACISYGTIGLIFRALNHHRSNGLSVTTRKVQRMFARATLFQLLLPFVLLYLPTFNAVLIMLNIEPATFRRELIYGGSCLLSMYPLGNTLVTIFFIQSYRRHLLSIISKVFRCIHYSEPATIVPSVVTVRRKTLPSNIITPFEHGHF